MQHVHLLGFFEYYIPRSQHSSEAVWSTTDVRERKQNTRSEWTVSSTIIINIIERVMRGLLGIIHILHAQCNKQTDRRTYTHVDRSTTCIYGQKVYSISRKWRYVQWTTCSIFEIYFGLSKSVACSVCVLYDKIEHNYLFAKYLSLLYIYVGIWHYTTNIMPIMITVTSAKICEEKAN